MKTNESKKDRMIRISISIIVFLMIGNRMITGELAVVTGFLAGVLAITGILGVCPFYLLYEIRTKHLHK